MHPISWSSRGCGGGGSARPRRAGAERLELLAKLGLVRLQAQRRLEGGDRPVLPAEAQVGFTEKDLQIRVFRNQACPFGQEIHDLRSLAAIEEGAAQIEVGGCITRVDRESLRELCLPLRNPSPFQKRKSEVVVHVGVIWIEGDRLAIGRDLVG